MFGRPGFCANTIAFGGEIKSSPQSKLINHPISSMFTPILVPFVSYLIPIPTFFNPHLTNYTTYLCRLGMVFYHSPSLSLPIIFVPLLRRPGTYDVRLYYCRQSSYIFLIRKGITVNIMSRSQLCLANVPQSRSSYYLR